MTPQTPSRNPSSNRLQPLLSKKTNIIPPSRNPSLNRLQPLSSTKANRLPPPPPISSRLAEVSGGATAEVASVCCCCPYILVNFLVLSVYRIPASLCREALKSNKERRKRKQLNTAGFFPRRKTCVYPISVDLLKDDINVEKMDEREVMELEKEMWEKFHATGFWRSPSQKEE